MKFMTTSLATVAGLTVAANAQLIKFLVSSDGVNFSSSLQNASGNQTIQVLVTVSYTGTSTAVAGFGSANFQPVISNWRFTDTLQPIRQGGNQSPTDGSGMVMPQFYTGVSAGDSSASYGHIHAGYAPGTYGRVLPMGRDDDSFHNALVGFIHVNPDATGRTYLRIAQFENAGWIGTPANDPTRGVNPGQVYISGRTSQDPDFWGNRESNYDPDFGWFPSGRIAANDSRRLNVEVFRFAFRLDDDQTTVRTLVIDAPLAAQQAIGYYTGASETTPGLQVTPVVQSATVVVNNPTPGALPLLGLGYLASRRRRARVMDRQAEGKEK